MWGKGKGCGGKGKYVHIVTKLRIGINLYVLKIWMTLRIKGLRIVTKKNTLMRMWNAKRTTRRRRGRIEWANSER